MANTLTRNLKLRVSDTLAADARFNLETLDALASIYQIDTNSDANVRSTHDIIVQTEDPDIGGSGSGGTVSIGVSGQPVGTLAIYATTVTFSTGLSLNDQATGGTKKLNIKYNSTLSGSVDTSSDRNLSVDVQGADRSLILAGDLTTVGGSVTLTTPSSSSVTLPTTGTLATLAGVEVLTNKTITASTNTISGLTTSNLSASAAIAYSQLSLTGSLLNADIAGSAAIAYSKLNLSLSVTNSDISTSAAIAYSKLNLASSIVDADVSSSAAIAGSKVAPTFGAQIVSTTSGFSALGSGYLKLYNSSYNVQLIAPTLAASYTLTLPTDDGTPNQLLQTNGSGVLSWTSAVLTSGLLQYNIWVGDSSDLKAAVDTNVLGDIAATSTGGLEIKAGAIVNADVNATAAIAVSKLAAVTASKALVSDASGFIAASSTTTTQLQYLNAATGTTGTTSTNIVFSTSPTLVTPALGTPSSGTPTSCSGLPVSAGISGLGIGVATFLATPSSANLAAALTDETGSGVAVFATSPTLVTPVLGAATATSINGLTITSSTGTLTITNLKTLSVSNTLTFTGTDSSSVAFGTGGTVAYIANKLSVFAATTSSELAGVISDETGSGALVFATSPVLVTPALGTPSSGTLTSCTGLPISTGVSGLAAGIATFLGTPSSANLISAVTDETGTGALVFATSPVLVTPALGTPSSGTLTSCTGLPISTGVSGLAAGVAAFLATPSSANLITAVTDETGTGALVFGTAPTIAGGSVTALTTFAIRDTSAAFDVTIAAVSSSALTAGRILTLDLVNAARTVKLTGNLTIAADFITSGANSLTLTTTGSTNVTLPTTGTLATLAGSEALTNKTVNGLTVTSSNGTLTIANGSSLVTSGANSITLTSAGATNVTLPTTGTLAILGANTFTAAQFVDGSADAIQMRVQGHSTQTSNTLTVEKSDATVLLAVTNTAGTQIRGTTTNTAAAAGFVGETINISRVRSNGTTLTSNTIVNVGTTTSITVTAGVWLFRANFCVNCGATTSLTGIECAVSLTSATLPAADTIGVPTAGECWTEENFSATLPGNGDVYMANIVPYVVALSADTTFYLVGRATFTSTAPTGFGWFEVTRII